MRPPLVRECQQPPSEGGTFDEQPDSSPAVVDTSVSGPTGTDADPAQGIVDTIAADEARAPSTRDRIFGRLFGDGDKPTQIDRFRLDRRLGSGGMGTVYEAWDEKLQRRVALKFLRKTNGDPVAEQRMFREAQGLAQLSHPNVVPVYDVGRHNGQVWIAMEYVPGKTLGVWVRGGPRKQAEILSHWIDAGRGLAAIHAAGLIHRDIKPDNVLIGEDGRVRIVDFGLVKVAGTLDGLSQSGGAGVASRGGISTASGRLSESVTNHDSFVGTPAYAAPEHWEQRWADARSDQYAFCVSLWEALCDTRPDRRERDKQGLVPLPPDVRLPRRLHLALSRGLSLQPDRRYPDMPALLAALTPPTRRWLAPSIAAGTTAVFAAALGYALAPTPTTAEAVDPCAETSTPIDAVWNDARRNMLAQHFGDHPQAQAMLEDWAGQWTDAARESCEAVHLHHRHSPEHLDRQSLCLDQSLGDFAGLLEAIERGQVDSSMSLGTWMSNLEAPSACLSEVALQVDYAQLSPTQQEEVRAMRRSLLGLIASTDPLLGRIRDGEQILERAQAMGAMSMVVQASLALGRLQTANRNFVAAREHIGRALDISTVARDLEGAADAWTLLETLARHHDFDLAAARWAWGRQAGLFNTVKPSPRRRAQLLVQRGLDSMAARDLGPAEVDLRGALQIYESLGPAVAWEHATALRSLGNVLVLRGRESHAVAMYDQARILEVTTDFGSPVLGGNDATTLLNEGLTQHEAGHSDKARPMLERGLRVAEHERGPRSELAARYHSGLVAVCDVLDDIDCMRRHAPLADEISLATVGPTHPLRKDVLINVGALARREGNKTAATAIFSEALNLSKLLFPADSLEVARAEKNMALILHESGHLDAAVPFAEHALPILEREGDDGGLVYVLRTLGAARLSGGDRESGRALLERARTLLLKNWPDSSMIIEIDDLLASKG